MYTILKEGTGGLFINKPPIRVYQFHLYPCVYKADLQESFNLHSLR